MRLKEPGGNMLEADEAQIENHFRDGFAHHLRLLLTNDATLTADYAVRRDGYLTVLRPCHLYPLRDTACSRMASPLWQLKSARSRAQCRAEASTHHRTSRFELAGIPVFWLPYLSHPDPLGEARQRLPHPEPLIASTDYGFGIETPYFFNLAPNYDLTRAAAVHHQ